MSSTLSTTSFSIKRHEILAKVQECRCLVQNEFEMVFFAPPIALEAQPGQFVEILYGQDYAPLLRRPFSIYRVDRDRGLISILFLARGSFTSGLSQKKPGDTVSLIGPLGRPFHWKRDNPTQHILVAGGIGVPPIYFLAETLHHARQHTDVGEIIVLNGAKSKEMLVGLVEFGRLELNLFTLTDDGSHGEKGLVTDRLRSLLLLHSSLPRSIYACGPTPMLQAVAKLAIEFNVPCQISVETSMPCGVGFCNGCVVRVKTTEGMRYARACWEGPVFDAKMLHWNNS